MTALMCAALCWMLQAWLPAPWALLGGVIAVLRIGLFSYWINTYSGGGSVAALGGASLLGGLPRFIRTNRMRDSFLMAVGLCVLALSRPYKGLLLCLPVGLVLMRWIFSGPRRPTARLIFRSGALPLALIVAVVAWLGYYNYRAFGNRATLPYSVDRTTYAAAPYWIWQSPRPEPPYRHKSLRDFYVGVELSYARWLHTVSGFLSETLLAKPLRTLYFFAGFALLPPLTMVLRVLIDRRIRFLVVCVAVVVSGVLVETWLIPLPGTLHLALPEWPASAWSDRWFGRDHFGTESARVESGMEQLPGQQLVIVRYSACHNPLDEWVYSAPDIDDSKVVWARGMDRAHNLELLYYSPNRKVWLVEPDMLPATVLPYPATQKFAADSR